MFFDATWFRDENILSKMVGGATGVIARRDLDTAVEWPGGEARRSTGPRV